MAIEGAMAITEKILARKRWKTSGKTPHATLYVTMMRDERFVRGSKRGTFRLKKGAA